MNLTLQTITVDNYEEVGELYLPEEQQNHLSHNMWSIAESMFNKSSHEARAIYYGEAVVGFAMWVRQPEKFASIWRFMIAHEYQRQGLGRKALTAIINEIKVKENPEIIEICYSPKNLVARSLYLSVGFEEAGMNEDGDEVVAVIDLGQA